MLKFDVRSDISKVLRGLDPVTSKQLAFTISKAINTTAQQVKSAEIAEMKRKFDRPTPFTLNSLFVKPARKTDLTAFVWLKDFAGKGTPASKYLRAQIEGGVRPEKRVEALLKRRGIMQPGQFIVPGRSADYDAYGNVRRSVYNKALSQIGAQLDINQNESIASRKRRKARNGARYFAATDSSHLPAGVYRAEGRKITPVLLFVDSANYEARFEFMKVAKKVINENFTRNLQAAWRFANATAK